MKANFLALQNCSLSLKDLMEKEDLSAWLAIFKKLVVSMMDVGYKAEFEGESKEEMKELWEKIYTICSEILSLSINLIYSSTTEIIESAGEAVFNHSEDDKKMQNASIAFRYLSEPDVCRKMVSE